MRKILAFLLCGGLTVAASQASAQGKPLGVLHISDPAGPASERSSHEYDCGRVGGHKVSLEYANHGRTSELMRLKVDGHDYTKDVDAQIDLRNSHFQNPYLLCTDVGVVVGVQAIDMKRPLPRRTVEMIVDGKASKVTVKEFFDSEN